MRDGTVPPLISRSDYMPYNFLVEEVDLCFELEDESTRVLSCLSLRRNQQSPDGGSELELDGFDLVLHSVVLDGVALFAGTGYTLTEDHLVLHNVPDDCRLTIETQVNPKKNTALEGLYQSSGNYCTQCEAEGFRRITYFPDRPDVMSRFQVKIIADKKRFPVLLSNGNEVDRGDFGDGRHWVIWCDPFPKPCYLFALVAGDLRFIQSSYVTGTGRTIDLRIYVEAHNIDKCDHAMTSLIRAMRWDEEVYGLEYDLDIYMIVAVDDFNMGAMENKGLNVFNTKYILANQLTATDADFQSVESVVAHEYFHNWTGNRVTCRDWFQLSLKEGLTVFRDQEFSADLNSRAVKRIEDVRILRNRQFPEDAGPLAHSIRPDTYIEINNFYTVTVYEKGAEVIRMMHTILGAEKYRCGIDLYFKRHDGQAVTCEDFICAMETASNVELHQFRYWYSQAGTPKVTVKTNYDQTAQTYKLTLEQSTPETPDQREKQPLHIPFAVALFDKTGVQLPLHLDDGVAPTERVLNLTAQKMEYVFKRIRTKPVPSFLRGFSAPVILDYKYSDDELAFRLAHDTDAFSRWESGQMLATRRLERFANGDSRAPIDELFVNAFGSTLLNTQLDAALRAEIIKLPTIESVAERQEIFDIERLAAAHRWLRESLARALYKEMVEVSAEKLPADCEFQTDAESIGRRSLRNACLSYLVLTENHHWQQYALDQFKSASTMTDQIAALVALIDCGNKSAGDCLQDFYSRWRDERLVIDKWFSIQAMADSSAVLSRVKALMKHEDFEITNPNRVRSLIGSFTVGNPVHFHAADGSGYQFLVDCVLELDDINPQVAARLVSPLIRWGRFDAKRGEAMRKSLQSITEKGNLSNDVYEITSRALHQKTVPI